MVRLPDNRIDDTEQNAAPSLTALSQEVKELVRLISTTDVSELHLESGSMRITIKRGGVGVQGGQGVQGAQPSGTVYANPVYTPPATLPESSSSGVANLIGNNPAHSSDLALNEGEEVVVAELVGTFYSASGPNEKPYVVLDDVVEPGQTVGIIEAMKMMNPIVVDFAGRITRILVENAQPVEYGQRLMVVQTT